MRALDLDATSFQNLIAKEKKKNWEDGYKHILQYPDTAR